MTKVLISKEEKEKKRIPLDKETLGDLKDKELLLNVQKGREEYKKGLTKPYRFKK